jgi:hypothetical protein
LRSVSSRPLWLLLSAAAAFGVLAWSAQRPQTFLGQPGQGFFTRMPVGTAGLISGVDSVTVNGGSAVCMTFTWGGGGRPSTSVGSSCRVVLRKLP